MEEDLPGSQTRRKKGAGQAKLVPGVPTSEAVPGLTSGCLSPHAAIVTFLLLTVKYNGAWRPGVTNSHLGTALLASRVPSPRSQQPQSEKNSLILATGRRSATQPLPKQTTSRPGRRYSPIRGKLLTRERRQWEISPLPQENSPTPKTGPASAQRAVTVSAIWLLVVFTL